MGGHGALTLFLKNPSLYQSVSALAPICNPTQVPWGQKAFAGTRIYDMGGFMTNSQDRAPPPPINDR